MNTHKVFNKHKTYMNAPETFYMLPILTFYYFSCVPNFKRLNPTLYSLLKETRYAYLDQCHCQLLALLT